MTTLSAVFDALASRVASAQTVSPVRRIAYPLVPFTPEVDEVYFRVSILPNETLGNPVGSGRAMLVGIFQVGVSFTHKGRGLVEYQEIAQEVVDMFPKGTLVYPTSGGKIKIPRHPWIAGVVSDSVRPFIPVSIPYEAEQAV